jgi:hypothetical protein
MAQGHSPTDWTVTIAGDEGTIRSAEYRGRFVVSRIGVVKIIWQGGGPGPGEDGPVRRAAQEAIAAALRR